MINIATDGACKGNPGPGGWGVAVFEGGTMVRSESGGSPDTTNNRMELIAFIEACKLIGDDYRGFNVTVHIDSTYVLKGSTEWLRGWRAKDYRGVKNEDLWRQVADLRGVWLDESVNLKWVKGHSGDLFNEAADKLASDEALRFKNDNDD